MTAEQKDITDKNLIAPCGMNCAVCSGYLARRYDVKKKGIKMPYCAGCRPRDKKCAFLKKRCRKLMNKKVNFCFECQEFPCQNLEHIDERYRANFHMSEIENLEFIKKNGLKKFMEKEAQKWKCPKCGGLICCHNGLCFNCELEKLKKKKKLYRWEEK